VRTIHSIGVAGLAGLVTACGGRSVLDGPATESGGAGATSTTESAGAGGAGTASSECFDGGAPPETASLVFPSWALAVVASRNRLLVAAPQEGGVVSAAPDGSDRKLVAAVDLPAELAVDSTHVYWREIVGDSPNLQEALGRAPLAGGSIEQLFETTGQDLFTNIATDGANVYFSGALAETFALFAVPVQGGTLATLSSASLGHVATDAQSVFFDEFTAIRRVDVSGKNVKVLYDSAAGVSVEQVGGVAVDDTDVYFTIGQERLCCDFVYPCPCQSTKCCTVDPDGGRLMRVPKQGGEAVTLLANLRLPTAVAVDEKFVYAIDTGGNGEDGTFFAEEGRVLAVPKQGGTVDVLADHQILGMPYIPQLASVAGDLAILGRCVFFTVDPQRTGGAMRVLH